MTTTTTPNTKLSAREMAKLLYERHQTWTSGQKQAESIAGLLNTNEIDATELSKFLWVYPENLFKDGEAQLRCHLDLGTQEEKRLDKQRDTETSLVPQFVCFTMERGGEDWMLYSSKLCFAISYGHDDRRWENLDI